MLRPSAGPATGGWSSSRWSRPTRATSRPRATASWPACTECERSARWPSRCARWPRPASTGCSSLWRCRAVDVAAAQLDRARERGIGRLHRLRRPARRTARSRAALAGGGRAHAGGPGRARFGVTIRVMIDWALAQRVAGLLSGTPAPATLPGDLAARADDGAARVTAYTGLTPAVELPPPEAVDRAPVDHGQPREHATAAGVPRRSARRRTRTARRPAALVVGRRHGGAGRSAHRPALPAGARPVRPRDARRRRSGPPAAARAEPGRGGGQAGRRRGRARSPG